MNTKGIKFLAVLAVLTMVFAAFAIIAPVDAGADEDRTAVGLKTEPIAISVNGTQSLKLYLPTGVNVVGEGAIASPAVIDLKGTTANNTVKDSMAVKLTGSMWGKTTGYAFMDIGFNGLAGLTGLDDTDYIWFYQKSTVLSVADKETEANYMNVVAGTQYSEKIRAYTWADLKANAYGSDLGILIPQDGTSIVLDIYLGDNTAPKSTYAENLKIINAYKSSDLIASITFNTEKVVTEVDLNDLVTREAKYPYNDYTMINSNFKDWKFTFDATSKTLSGNIGSNVTFKGDGIKVGSGITDAMMKDAGFDIKLTQGGKSAYYQSFQKALDDVTADATITLLDDCYSAESLAYTKAFALTVDLNGKELCIQADTTKDGKIGEGLFEIGNAQKAVKIANGTISVMPIKLAPETQKTLSVIENFNTSTELYNVHVEGEGIVADPAIGWDTVIFNRNGTLTLSGNTKICGEYSKYAIVSDSFKHVHDDVAYTGSLVKIGSSDVLVDGGMIVTYSTTQASGWAADQLTGKGFDISAGKYTGVLERGAITLYNTWTYAITPYDVATYGDDMTFALTGGTFVEYSALQYVEVGAQIYIDDGGKGVPAGPAKEAEISEGKLETKDLKEDVINTLYVTSAAAIEKLEADLGNKEVVIIGNDKALSGVKMTVSGSGTVAFYGFTTVTGTVTTGTGSSAQIIGFKDAVGEFTVSQGSIVLNTDFKGGKILLRNGDVLKLSGNVLVTGSIEKDPADTSTSFSAKVIVEAGDNKALNIASGATLTVAAGIAFEIEGKVTGLGTLAVAKSITVKDGGVLATKVISATSNTAYSGGDINEMTIVIPDGSTKAKEWKKWTGKDAASGTWTYVDGTLTLSNYNGTYNFAKIGDEITDIELNGDNIITVKEPVLRPIDTGEIIPLQVLFGGNNLKSITTDGAGSLSIIVDISEVEGKYLGVPLAVIYAGATAASALDINGVGIGISVNGSNPDWKTEETDELCIAGIAAVKGIKFFDAPVVISIMPGYEVDNIVGITSETTLDITGKTMLIDAATAIEVEGGATTIKTATIAVKGNVILGDDDFEPLRDLTISNASIFEINGGLAAHNVKISQESEIDVKHTYITGTLDNKGTVKIGEKAMILGTIDNYAVLENKGVIGVYGAFINTAPGVFNNDGTLNVYAMKQKADEASLEIEDSAATAGNAKLKSISITGAKMDYDGTIKFDAVVTVYKSAGYSEVSDKFEGAVTPGLNGYSLTLSSNTASITIVYDSEAKEPTKVGSGYQITVSGSVKVGDDNLYLQANTTATGKEATVTDSVKKDGLFQDSGADFDIVSGTVNNEEGTIVVASVAGDSKEVIINSNATFNGNIITRIADATVKGAFNGTIHAHGAGTVTVADINGNIHSMGSVVVSKDKTMVGDIVAKKTVSVIGALVGNITAGGSVDINEMLGTITVNRAHDDTAEKTVTANGACAVNVVYNTKYKATKDATETTEYSATMTIAGTPNGLIINLVSGSDATASSEVVPGYFGIGATGKLKDNKTADIILTDGRILVDTPVTLESRYYLTIEAGATIEVKKTGGAALDVKKGALKVSKDANALFETGSGTPVNYGKVLFIMAFQIDDGAYTIYSDVAYALLNCEENTELVVGESAEIDQNVTVKAGVSIIVNDITLTFTGKNVEMLEGAKITLEGTGKVIFKESGNNKADVKKGEAITYYHVCGTIYYDLNAVVFTEARFTADSTVQGVKATSTAASKIKTDLSFDEGIATIAAGNGTGTIALLNDVNDITKDDEPETVMVSAKFVVAADAVFDAVKITDSAAKVLYKNYTDEPEIKEYTLLATIVGVEGTLNLSDDTVVNGTYVGFGKVTLAAGKFLKFNAAEAPAKEAEKFVPGSVNTYVVDTTDDANGYLFNFATTKAGTAKPLTVTAGTFTISGEKINVMKLSGDFYVGTAKATTEATLDAIDVYESAVVYGDVVYVINNSTTMNGGYVGAKTIFMDEAPFKELKYDVNFEKDGYTIYAKFASVDWDAVTDVAIYGKVTTGEKKLDLSGKDVNIYIDKDAEFKVTSVLIIGTPATVLGDEGSSIVGKVIIQKGADPKAYLVAYADVDLSMAEIVDSDKNDAVFSKLDVEDVPYAVIFAAEADNVVLAKADASLIPEIVGYNFTAWLNYNGDSQAKIGETNAYADAKATLCTIIVKYVAGVDYYMNGVLFNVYDIPTDVAFGSYFSAKISDTSKYQGNPVINGEKTVCVLDDMELVASGVTPIPEPTPEPVEENTGLSLTDILLIVLVILIAIMVVILVLRLNRS